MADLVPLLADPPADLRIVHEMGLSDAPDDPVGAQVLTLSPSGSLRLDWAHDRRSGSFAAQVDPSVVRRLLDLLVAGRFPDIEWIDFPPGPSFRVLAVRRGDADLARVFLARTHYERTPPWDEACRILDALCVQVRGPLDGFADTLPRVVTGVRRL